jgi:hypothetical protein
MVDSLLHAEMVASREAEIRAREASPQVVRLAELAVLRGNRSAGLLPRATSRVVRVATRLVSYGRTAPRSLAHRR